jgi:hypothetical protein
MTSQVVVKFPAELLQEARSATAESRRGFDEVMVRSVQAGLHSLKMAS